MKPLVSILIPAFNAENWIGETIESGLRQTWERKEIIVVDDGSTDRTLDIARQFESRNVLVVTQENQGAAEARNKGLSICQGEYIQWLDADDLLHHDKIAKQMLAADQLKNRRLLLSGAWGWFMYRPERAQFIQTDLWCDLAPAEWLIRKMAQNLHMQTATWLVSRELTDAAGPWNAKLVSDDDGEYFCRVLLRSDGVRFVRESKVFYRMTGSNRLSYVGRSDRKKEALFRSIELHIEYLRSLEESNRVREACITYLQNWLDHFYPERPDIVQQAEQVASGLGKKLIVPRLPWKYAWIRAVLGWRLAKLAQMRFPQVRWALARFFDRMVFLIENSKLASAWRDER